ncbi:hypothetical protein SAMN06295879_1296 [Agreia bicolorata]|uniref:Signal peptidase I n=1 Tax=Agreia bicolorata TaxID=110935 RepID=A0A1T4XL43_9MICO|nr:DUF5684 domain-containing protein [Agreia bicolorata]KJC65033.1 hypothetical protein TZ00_05500 [Agreia bicolorata]SKA90282.1 hypothetical protein SAMN06295879_1296 [Agreia bicolorata]
MEYSYEYQADPVTTTLSIVLAVIAIAGLWATFIKADRHGWAAIIPIYNIYTLVKVAGRPGWWTILFFIPIVNIVIHIIVALDVAKRFGKSGVFGFFLLFLLGFIGYPIIGFGKAQYNGAQAA